MADEFVKLSKSSEPNLDLYLNVLDGYLLQRDNKIKQNQKLLDKIRNKIGTSWDFTQLYEKAKDKSKKNNTHLILEYIDLLDKTNNIGDDWITNQETRKAVNNIKNRMYGEAQSTLTATSKTEEKLKTMTNEIAKNLEKGTEKIKEFKNQSLPDIKKNLTTAKEILSDTRKKIPDLKN